MDAVGSKRLPQEPKLTRLAASIQRGLTRPSNANVRLYQQLDVSRLRLTDKMARESGITMSADAADPHAFLESLKTGRPTSLLSETILVKVGIP